MTAQIFWVLMTQLLLATPGLFLMPAESLQGPRWDPDAGQETLVWQVLLGIEFNLVMHCPRGLFISLPPPTRKPEPEAREVRARSI